MLILDFSLACTQVIQSCTWWISCVSLCGLKISASSPMFRMPAILDGDEAIRKWLDFAEISTQEALRLIHSTENIAFHPVSTIVNNSRNNTPECLAPIQLGLKKVRSGG